MFGGLQHFLGKSAVARNGDGGYEPLLVRFLITDLRDGNVAAVAEAILQSLDPVTLVFERFRFGNR